MPRNGVGGLDGVGAIPLRPEHGGDEALRELLGSLIHCET